MLLQRYFDKMRAPKVPKTGRSGNQGSFHSQSAIATVGAAANSKGYDGANNQHERSLSIEEAGFDHAM